MSATIARKPRTSLLLAAGPMLNKRCGSPGRRFKPVVQHIYHMTVLPCRKRQRPTLSSRRAEVAHMPENGRGAGASGRYRRTRALVHPCDLSIQSRGCARRAANNPANKLMCLSSLLEATHRGLHKVGDAAEKVRHAFSQYIYHCRLNNRTCCSYYNDTQDNNTFNPVDQPTLDMNRALLSVPLDVLTLTHVGMAWWFQRIRN